MCGRYVIDQGSDALAAALGAHDATEASIAPHFNIPPTSTVPVVIASGGERRLGAMRWGIAGERDGRPTLSFNSRLETLVRRNAPSSYRRCLVPAAGYYEWQQASGERRPFFLRDPGHPTMTMAGIYRGRRTADGAVEWAFSIVTTAAAGSLAEIHARRPLVVPPEEWDDWLDGAEPLPAQLQLLDGLQLPLDAVPVGSLVGDVRNNAPSLMLAVDRD
ncbi:MAG: hypothetical protein QOH57_901 [Mycobacterium sp.]|nr:hypothetical protein [Mycobacterium sp.]